jgi:hypothetical protein
MNAYWFTQHEQGGFPVQHAGKNRGHDHAV